MTREEIAYLAGNLASRAEWQRLWSVILDLPLNTAASLMHHFSTAAWEPADEDGRRLFKQFRRAFTSKAASTTSRSPPTP
jgi:hypothetical protein